MSFYRIILILTALLLVSCGQSSLKIKNRAYGLRELELVQLASEGGAEAQKNGKIRTEEYFETDDSLKLSINEYVVPYKERFSYRAHLEAVKKPTPHQSIFPSARFSRTSLWHELRLFTSTVEISDENLVIKYSGEGKESEKTFIRSDYPELQKTNYLCFFDTLYECGKLSGFFKQAISKKKGRMNFTILWNGFPWIEWVSKDLKDMAFSSAELEFNGEVQKNRFVFSLYSAGQTFMLALNEELELIAFEWPIVGIGRYPIKK
jgi:hypothetical protein